MKTATTLFRYNRRACALRPLQLGVLGRRQRQILLQIILVIFALCLPATSRAFTNAEYEELMNSSEEFRRAEQQLTATWKSIYPNMTDENAKKRLLQEQRKWIWSGRDVLAKELMASGIGKGAAYARSTYKRIEELQAWQALATKSRPPVMTTPEQADTQYESFEKLRRLAEQGDTKAQAILGYMYSQGSGGVLRDDQQALYWLLKAADQGDKVALFGLCMHHYGLCVNEDVHVSCEAAVLWCREAGDQGIAEAYSILGAIYEEGLAGVKDLRQAKMWYRKAATQGEAYAQEALRALEGDSAGSMPSATTQTSSVEQACVFIASNGDEEGIRTGSGFFVAPGYVVTNAHVVAGSSDALVTGQSMPGPAIAQVIVTGQSGERDYAVLRLNPDDYDYIRPLVFAAGVQRAERVGAWGFPGLINSADPNYHRFMQGDFSTMPTLSYTEGVVSAVLERNPTMIVHSVPISPGSSGSPLVNASGDVVGINTKIKLSDRSYHQASIALSGRDLLQFLRNNGIPAQSR